MGIPECVARTGSGSAAVAAQSRAGISKSQHCHRTRGWLDRQAVGATPVGSTKGYGTHNFPQVRRTGLRLDRVDAGQSGRPKHPPPGCTPPGLPTPRIVEPRNPAAPTRRERRETGSPTATTHVVARVRSRDGDACRGTQTRAPDDHRCDEETNRTHPRTHRQSPPRAPQRRRGGQPGSVERREQHRAGNAGTRAPGRVGRPTSKK